MRGGGVAFDQQRLGCAADAGAAHLGVEHHRLRHVEIGRVVDIDVVDAFEMCEHRYAGFGFDAVPTRLLPPRGTIRSTAPSRPLSSRPTAARSRVGTKRDRGFRQVRPRASRRRDRRESRWPERKLSEPPRRITALPDFRQRTPASAVTLGRLSKITRDHAQRYAHAFDGHAVGALPAFGDDADWIGNVAHDANAVGDTADAGGGRRPGGR